MCKLLTPVITLNHWMHIVVLLQLLGNILEWHQILSNKVVLGLALNGLLNRYLLLALQNSIPGSDMVAKCQAVRVRRLPCHKAN